MSRLTFDPGIPLSHYRQHKAGVLLICDACTYVRRLPIEAVISRLIERGVGDENTGIRHVAKLTTGPCPECGRSAWQTRPAFPSIPGQDGITPRTDC